MKTIRTLALAVVGGLIALGFVVDRGDRPASDPARVQRSALAVTTDPATTWFCPGGSGPDGVAELALEIVSGSPEPRTARVSVAPGGRVNVAGAVFKVDVAPGARVVLAPADAVPGAQWVGAVVEVDGSDVVVEQTVAGLVGGVGRSPCLTRTAERWIVPYGATRFEAEGERFVVMLLNPYPDDAVADVGFAADLGSDSLTGVVIPAGEVVAIDVTEEVTVASAVAVTVETVAGRLSVSRLQVVNGPNAGRGIRLSPGVPGAASLWHLPVSAVADGRRDRVAVTNPSEEFAAEVDIEVLADGTGPGSLASGLPLVEVRPGRTVLVDLTREVRPAGEGPMSLVVRSLAEEVPVAVSLDSVVLPDAPGPAGAAGTAAAAGADSAARRWLVPVESADPDPGPAGSSVVIVNPSAAGIATIELGAGGEVIEEIELAPGRRVLVPVAELASRLAVRDAAAGVAPDRFLLEVASSAPVVAARELVGLTSRTAALGVAVGEAIPLTEVP